MFAPALEEPLKKHCFGDCGKISIGGIVDTGDVAGPCWICHQEECPHEKGNAGPVGEMESTGDNIFIRVIETAPKV